MARNRTRHTTALAFDAVTVEGALIATAMLARIAQHQAGAQSEADYAVPKGLSLREEIARYFRIGQALFAELTASKTPSHAATVAFVEKLLHGVFGFADVRYVDSHANGERQFAVTLEGLDGRVPIVVVPSTDDLDHPRSHLLADGRRRSAASAVQDRLNAGEGALWGLCLNGSLLRLVRGNASLTRPAYIEADLRRIFVGEAFADFAVLWLLIHSSRFGLVGTPPSDCALEHWREAGQREGLAARDRLRDGVEAALLSLGNGFLSHSENAAVRDRLRTGSLPLSDFFGQLLRLVYRLIFLLAAEDRNLLHGPGALPATRKLYADGYSVGALRDRAVRRAAWDRHHDRWEGLLITFAGVARGEPRLGLPALDGLFARGTIPDLDIAKLANRSLMEAIYRLAWLKEDSGIVPVNWRDMETEELGSVYESLLELTPHLTDDGRGFAFAEGDETKGHTRKTSGSYYTPDSLVQVLLDSALDPVLDRIEAEAEDRTAALLSVAVLDPACGSGHFLLAAARRIATRLARTRTGGVASPADYRHALRDIARACIHGVDRNPMAVELTKVALWIETVEPGKPLGFLDANIRCGDSLFGLFDLKALEEGIPDAAYKPLLGDDKETAKYFEKRNKAEHEGQGSLDFAAGAGRMPAAVPLVGEARALRAMPEDSPEEISTKRKRFEAARADPHLLNLRIAADLYIAAFLTPKTGGIPANRTKETIPTTAHVWDALAGRTVYGPLVSRAQVYAGAVRAFHWPLEFPDIMGAGGFDVVLGNPPWEVSQVDDKEYFAVRAPEIASLEGTKRKAAIAALKTDSPGLWNDYQNELRLTETTAVFTRASSRFPTTSIGKLNLYALFSELSALLLKPEGRAGIIVQSGIATDQVNSEFFEKLIDQQRIVSLYDMVNTEGIFPGVHRSHPHFCLLTITGSANKFSALVSFHNTNANHLRDERRVFLLLKEDISLFNPNTLTCPIFRSIADATLTRKIYLGHPVLIKERGSDTHNPWSATIIQNFFSHTSDGGLFHDYADIARLNLQLRKNIWGVNDENRWLPLYEGKMIDQFDHRFGSFRGRGADRGNRVLPSTTLDQYTDPMYEPLPHFWVGEQEVVARASAKNWRKLWLLVWKDITTSVTERTTKAAIIPLSATDDTVSIMTPGEEYISTSLGLLANLNSIVLDYISRQKVSGLHLRRNVIIQLPILSPDTYSESDITFIRSRVLELTYTSYSLAPFARDFGFDGEPFAWDEDRRAQLRAELDAWYARAYGLSRDELRYVLDPADVKGSDYPSETFRVLKKNEVTRFGEYRTARLVLGAYDQLTSQPVAAE